MASFKEKIITRMEDALPPAWSARLRYKLARRSYFYPFGTAMNGQTSRLEATRQILFHCGIRQIIETGTFRGTTTEWFAQFKLPVTTIESNPQSHAFAKMRLAPNPQVKLELGNSVKMLQQILPQLDLTAPTFFYLDAHWEDYLPLKDEMAIIFEHFKAPVVLVDDFQVPGDSGYTFDDYGPGKALTTAYLDACVPADVARFYPATLAAEETGARRGWVVVTPHEALAAKLGAMDLLRSATI